MKPALVAALALAAGAARAESGSAAVLWDCESWGMHGRVSITDVDESQIVYGADGLNFPLSKVPATSGAKYIGPLPDSGGVLAFWWDMGESAHYGLILHEDEPTLMGECRKAPADTDADGS